MLLLKRNICTNLPKPRTNLLSNSVLYDSVMLKIDSEYFATTYNTSSVADNVSFPQKAIGPCHCRSMQNSIVVSRDFAESGMSAESDNRHCETIIQYMRQWFYYGTE
jgi:hypothetical protein